MKKIFKIRILKKSFKREIFTGLLLAACIPVLITSILLVNVFKSRLKKDYEKEVLVQIDSISSSLTTYFENIEKTINKICAEKKITSVIGNSDSWDNSKAYSKLYSITDSMRNTAGFNIFDINGNIVFTTESEVVIDSLPTYWGILKVSFTHPEKMIIKRCVLPEKEGIILQSAQAILEDEELIGFVVVNTKKTDIETILGKEQIESNELLLLDSFYEELFSSTKSVENNLAQLIRSRIFLHQSLHQIEDKITFFINDIGTTGLILVLGKDSVLTDDITRTMWGVIIVIGIFSLMLCLFGASIYSDYLSVPVKQMTDAMNKLKNGNLDVKINSSRQDELGQLSTQFDNMTLELKNYMELKEKHQQEINDSNIAMMQAQLNPHFLYNTLDTMKWVAKSNQVPVIAKMSSDLAQILRMSISEKKFITLKEEMELVEKYVEIQQIRFSQSFTYDVEFPMELEDCIIPKLIVQPIVENAIIHGLKETQKGSIFTNIYEENNCLIIEVSDNGCGIDEEIVRKINSRDRKDFKGHIGFYNVDTIIRLYYGENFGIKAKKNIEGGTTVCITMPVKKDEI